MVNARNQMILVAERLVAERGLAALTLRDVQTEAGQRNKSAAAYHFGSREGLLEAVIEARMAPVNHRRSFLLDRARTTRDLVEALVLPLAEQSLHTEDSHYARFLAQGIFDPALAGSIRSHLQAQSLREVLTRIADRPDVPAELGAYRANQVVLFALTALATAERLLAHPEETQGPHPDAATVVSDLIDTCTALVLAPHTAASNR